MWASNLYDRIALFPPSQPRHSKVLKQQALYKFIKAKVHLQRERVRAVKKRALLTLPFFLYPHVGTWFPPRPPRPRPPRGPVCVCKGRVLIGLGIGVHFDPLIDFGQDASSAWGRGDTEVGWGVHIPFFVGSREKQTRLLKVLGKDIRMRHDQRLWV